MGSSANEQAPVRYEVDADYVNYFVSDELHMQDRAVEDMARALVVSSACSGASAVPDRQHL
jgi:hypothetical protein